MLSLKEVYSETISMLSKTYDFKTRDDIDNYLNDIMIDKSIKDTVIDCILNPDNFHAIYESIKHNMWLFPLFTNTFTSILDYEANKQKFVDACSILASSFDKLNLTNEEVLFFENCALHGVEAMDEMVKNMSHDKLVQCINRMNDIRVLLQEYSDETC